MTVDTSACQPQSEGKMGERERASARERERDREGAIEKDGRKIESKREGARVRESREKENDLQGNNDSCQLTPCACQLQL